MKYQGWQLEDGIFGPVRNESMLSPDEDEKLDQEHFDEARVAVDANNAARRLAGVIKDLHWIRDGIDQMLKYAEDPIIDKDKFKLYVDSPGKDMVEMMFKVAAHIKGVTRLLPALQFCSAMEINTRRGTFYPKS
jgi:hypothetical protein